MKIPLYIKKSFKNLLGKIYYKVSYNNSENLHWIKKIKIDSIVDIGANVGQFAKEIRVLFPKTPLFCFEPLIDVFLELKKETEKIKNVTLFNYSLGSENKITHINEDEYSQSSSILKMTNLHKNAFPFTGKTKKIKTEVKKLDEIKEIKNECRTPLIKIDTQGYELEIIKGGIGTINRSPILIIELSYEGLYEDQPLFDDIYKILCNNGFRFAGNLNQLLDPRNFKPLQTDAIFINKKYEN